MSVKEQTYRWPGMLLVGGAGRNSGKTTFSCSLIKRFCQRHQLVALKVTAIRERGGPCPRGNDSCGVCSSLSGSYEITEEHGDPPGKDTSLMVASGAQRVYWMRVMREHLAEGTAALMGLVGPDTICICESNTLRHVVEPSVFVIVKDKRSKTFKRSSREVLHLADRVVLSDGRGFDLSGDEVEFRAGRWTLRGMARRPTGVSAAELEAQGWKRCFIADEPRLSEAVETYEELGLEVLLMQVTQRDAECTECMQQTPERFKVIYTRPRSDEGEDAL